MKNIYVHLEPNTPTIIQDFPMSGTWLVHLRPHHQDISNSRYTAFVSISFIPQPDIWLLSGDPGRFKFKVCPVAKCLYIELEPFFGPIAPLDYQLIWYNPSTIFDEFTMLKESTTILRQEIDAINQRMVSFENKRSTEPL
jgi:hypothetical protein